jgi:hypothetical protein
MASTQSQERWLEVVPSACAFINNLSQLRQTTIRAVITGSKIYRKTHIIYIEGMMSLWRYLLPQYTKTTNYRVPQRKWGSYINPSYRCQTCLSICRNSLKWESSRSIWLSSTKHTSSATSLAKITIHLILMPCAFCNMSIGTEYKMILLTTLRLFQSTLGYKKGEITTLPLKDMVSEAVKPPLLKATALNLRQQNSCQPSGPPKSSSKWPL